MATGWIRSLLRVVGTLVSATGFLTGALVSTRLFGWTGYLPERVGGAIEWVALASRGLLGGSDVLAGVVWLLLTLLSLQLLLAVSWWTAPRHRLFQVALTDRGFVVVDEESIEALAAQAASTTRGVAEVKIRVRGPARGPLGIRAFVGLTPGAPVAEIGPEVQQRVLEAVERLVGISVASVSVRTRVLRTGELTRLLS